MGQGNSKLLSEQRQLQKIFTIDDRIKQQNIVYLTSRSNNNEYLLRQLIFNDEQQFHMMRRLLQQRRKNKCQYITNLQRLEQLKEENLCSQFYRLYTLWEYPRRTLSEEINQRALLKYPFTYNQINNILIDLCKGLSNYQSNCQSYQSLTTKSIVLTPQLHPKIVDVYAVTTRTNLETIFNKRNIKNIYLSPEQCAIIQSQEISNRRYDSIQSDIFIVGMMMLECSLLEKQGDCYQQDYQRINFRIIEQKLQLVEYKYGRQLKGLLQSMLAYLPKQRLDLKSIINRITKQQKPRLSLDYSKPKQQLNTSVLKVEKVQKNMIIPQIIQPSNHRVQFTFTYNKPVNVSNMPTQSINYNRLPPMIARNKSIRLIQNIRPQIITYNDHYIQITNNNYLSNNYGQCQSLTPAQSKLNQKISIDNNTKDTPQTMINNDSKYFKIINAQHHELDLHNNIEQQINNKKQSIFSIDRYAEGKRYQGFKVDGKKQGEGKFYLADSLCFQGNWKNDMMQGEGKLYYQSGTLAYEGLFHQDRFHGFGKLYNQSPQLLFQSFDYRDFQQIDQYWTMYEGYFNDDLKQGNGILYLSNGEKIQGNFHNDMIEGQCIFTKKNGEKIKGRWHENILEDIIV